MQHGDIVVTGLVCVHKCFCDGWDGDVLGASVLGLGLSDGAARGADWRQQRDTGRVLGAGTAIVGPTGLDLLLLVLDLCCDNRCRAHLHSTTRVRCASTQQTRV